MRSKKRQTIWSIWVRSADSARRLIGDSAKGFYIIAVIWALAALLLGFTALIVAVIYAGLALWMQRTNSRVAATLLLLAAITSLLATVVNRLVGSGGGGLSTILSILALWVGIRAVVGTYRLPGLMRERPATTVGA